MQDHADVRFSQPAEACDGAVGEASAIFESHQLSITLCKPGKEDGEASEVRIAVRNVRRDGMEHLKRAEKDGEMGKDEYHALSTKVQDLTDKIIKEVDEALASKEAEIMQV